MPEGFPGYQEETLVGPALSTRLVGSEAYLGSKDGHKAWDANAGNPPGSTVHIHDMATAIRHGHRPEVTGEACRIALSVSLAALKSTETGRVIAL